MNYDINTWYAIYVVAASITTPRASSHVATIFIQTFKPIINAQRQSSGVFVALGGTVSSLHRARKTVLSRASYCHCVVCCKKI